MWFANPRYASAGPPPACSFVTAMAASPEPAGAAAVAAAAAAAAAAVALVLPLPWTPPLLAPEAGCHLLGSRLQARCIAPVHDGGSGGGGSAGGGSQFLVGTLSLREENEIHLIRCGDDSSEITCEGLYAHQHEIWDLATCPYDARLFSTVHATAGDYGAAIWQLPSRAAAAAGSPGPSQQPPALEPVAQLKGHNARIKCVLWSPSGRHTQVISLDEEMLRVWDIDGARKFAAATGQASAGALQRFSGGCWDPHDVNSVATISETAVSCWDLRMMRQSHTIEHAHEVQVRDLDFSRRRRHLLVTAGDNAKLAFWDMRSLSQPLLDMPAHHHWAWRACFNPLHDELVLSAGTDCMVNLWHVPSIAAAMEGGVAQRRVVTEKRASVEALFESPRGPLDGLAQVFNEHEDSVYGIAWSATEPWTFASLSYDGRVVVDTVPSTIRRKVRR
eukprot:SM000080S22967  [mRNA]  locus=s80:449851:453302:+ [translate_table: standard]